MAGPKITVIGAGSYFFGRPVIHKMATSAVMAGGTLAMVDTNPRVLRTMMKLAKRVFEGTRCGVKLVGSTDRRKVMKDSDFVVLTFSERNAHFRGLDTDLAARHGIRMCSSDTIGPGGIFRACREVPRAIEMARDAARLCPRAWVVNFVNPATVLGMALRRYAPEVNSFALCDGNHEPRATLRWCKLVGIVLQDAASVPPAVLRRLDLAVGGVNHCTWVIRFRYDGKDMLPALRRVVVEEARRELKNPGEKSKPRLNWNYSLELLDVYGAYPTAVSHTKEYVPFFQGYGVAANKPEPIRLFDANNRASEMAAAWKVTEEYAAGRRTPKQFVAEVGDDHATDIIESMWGQLGKPFFINTINRGAIANLPDDALLELRCDIDMRGPRPQPVGLMPRGILAMQHQLLDAHELTAEAAMTGDRAILRRAMAADPICNNLSDIDGCLRDFLKIQKDALPAYWRRSKSRAGYWHNAKTTRSSNRSRAPSLTS